MNQKKNGDNHSPHIVVYLTRLEEVGCYFLGWPSMNWGPGKLEKIDPLVGRRKSCRKLLLTHCSVDTGGVHRGGCVFRCIELRHCMIKRS
jgi:hypothetical protein